MTVVTFRDVPKFAGVNPAIIKLIPLKVAIRHLSKVFIQPINWKTWSQILKSYLKFGALSAVHEIEEKHTSFIRNSSILSFSITIEMKQPIK